MDEPTALGQALDDQGRSQQWLAVQVSARLSRPVMRQQITRWVAGTWRPESAARAAIADALGVTIESLWPDHGADLPTNPLDADGSSSASEAAA